MAVSAAPTTLLLGGGYTLQRVAGLLPHGSFVMTSRSPETVEEWRASGITAEQADIAIPGQCSAIAEKYPSIQCVVDSVPPLRNAVDPAAGVKLVCTAFKNRGIRRLVYLSTTGVFGVQDGSWVDEQTPVAPVTPLGRDRAVSEAAYLASGLPVAALRLPAIYGPGRGLEVSMARGSYRMVEHGTRWSNRIHVDDLAAIICRCLDLDRTLPPALCVGDDEPTLVRDIVHFYCERFNLPLPPSITVDEARAAGAHTMLSNQRVRNDLMKRLLQVTLKYPNFRVGASVPGER